MTNETAPVVVEYCQRKVLAEMGYTFSGDHLTSFEIDCFTTIAAEFNECEKDAIEKHRKEMEKKAKKKG